MFFRLFLGLLVLCLPISVNAQSVPMQGECGLENVENKPELACDFRLSDPQSIRDVTMSLGGKMAENTTFEPFSKSDKTSAWLFMIDRTDPARKADVERHIGIVKEFAARARNNHKIGIATFGHDLRMLVDAENRYADIEDRLKDVKADGLSTEFYATSLQAIEILSEVEADRRALVIITDGKDEDTAFTADNVIEKAKEAGIVIYGMGFVPRENDSPQLQRLGIMASATGGPSIKVFGKNPVPVEFKERFFDYLENGGTVRGELSSAVDQTDVVVEAELVSGRRVEASLPIVGDLSDLNNGEPENLSFFARLYARVMGADSGATKGAQDNQLGAWAAILIALLLLVFAVFAMTRRSSPQAEPVPTTRPETIDDDAKDVSPTTGTIPTGAVPTGTHEAAAYGYLELVNDPGVRYWLNQDLITLGRHSASDIRLDNDSVHRSHAHIQRIDGIVTIVDMNTQNGVSVNGKKAAKRALQQGDEIELGEVKLRYFAN